MFGCRLGSYLLPALFLWAATATMQANFAGSDPLASGTNWTSMPQSGNGQLVFQNNRAEYLLGTTTAGDNLDIHYWNVNTGSYTSDWSVQVDVHLAQLSLPTDGDFANLNLIVTPNIAGGSGLAFSAEIDRSMILDENQNPSYASDFGTFLDYVNLGKVASSATDATLKINFNSTQKTLTAYYNAGSGWVQIGQPVSIAGWNMGNSDTFSVALGSNSGNFRGASSAAAVNSGDAYYKNFQASTSPSASVLVEDDFVGAAGASPDASKFEWSGEVEQGGDGTLCLNTVWVNTSWLRSKAGAAPGAGETLVLQMRAQAYAEPGIYGGGQPRGLRVGTDANNAVEFYSVSQTSVGMRVRQDGVESVASYSLPSGVDSMHDYEISVTPTAVVFKVDGDLAGTITSNIPTGALNVYVSTYDGGFGQVPVWLDSLSLSLSSGGELLTNGSFDTANGAGWSVSPLGLWAPFATPGEVDLNRSGTTFPTTILWQDLDISNVGGTSGTASMQLKKGNAPPGESTKVYLDYLDGSGAPQRLLLLNPDNSTVGFPPDGTLFSANFTLPADAQKVTGFSVDRTYAGQFQAMEFHLNLAQSPPVAAPMVEIANPATMASFASGETIPLVAFVQANGTTVTGVEFYDNGTLIGQAQASLFGRWTFPDTSELAVMGNATTAMVEYTPPPSENMYMMDGGFLSQNFFRGTFSNYIGEQQNTGNVDIQFSWGTNNTLNAFMTGWGPLGNRSLYDGTSENSQFSLSWSNAAVGPHALTARAYYGSSYVTSAPVSITVTGATTTRVIGLSGNLTFGNVEVGSSANATLTINNTGNSVLTVSSFSYPSGFTGNWASGTIAAGSSQNVTVTFSPSAAQPYSGMITVNSDATSGAHIIPAIGQGTQTPYEAWQADKFTADEIATGRTTPTADFEGDGMPNLLEYAFGKNPKVADVAGIVPAVSVNKMRISFPRDPACTDITYTVQASPNLSTWEDIAQSVGGAATAAFNNSGCEISDAGTGPRTVTVTEKDAFAGKRFLRVKVTSP